MTAQEWDSLGARQKLFTVIDANSSQGTNKAQKIGNTLPTGESKPSPVKGTTDKENKQTKK
jgi:hypothetical protein